MMMNWHQFKAYINYLSKAKNEHGLHSPFLFDFYNEVISSKKEFYLFDRLKALVKSHYSTLSQKELFFLFRWVAFYKPEKVKLQRNNFLTAIVLGYPCLTKTVCNHAHFSNAELLVLSDLGLSFEVEGLATLLYVDDLENFDEVGTTNYSCLIIKSPHENERIEKKWKQLLKLKDVTISIDVFHFGILLVDRNQAKQHFVVRM